VEWGVLPLDPHTVGGKATSDKWADVKQLAMTGQIDKIDPKTFVVHYRNLKQIASDMGPKPDDLDDCCGEWIWGPPGVGKSHIAREENPDAYQKNSTNKWWDGYAGQQVVIMDEMEIDAQYLGVGGQYNGLSHVYHAVDAVCGFKTAVRPHFFLII